MYRLVYYTSDTSQMSTAQGCCLIFSKDQDDQTKIYLHGHGHKYIFLAYQYMCTQITHWINLEFRTNTKSCIIIAS